jgi:hypothetical protein
MHPTSASGDDGDRARRSSPERAAGRRFTPPRRLRHDAALRLRGEILTNLTRGTPGKASGSCANQEESASDRTRDSRVRTPGAELRPHPLGLRQTGVTCWWLARSTLGSHVERIRSRPFRETGHDRQPTDASKHPGADGRRGARRIGDSARPDRTRTRCASARIRARRDAHGGGRISTRSHSPGQARHGAARRTTTGSRGRASSSNTTTRRTARTTSILSGAISTATSAAICCASTTAAPAARTASEGAA